MKNRFPIFIFLDRIRSLHNVGAFFRTADAIHAEKIFLSEYTPQPPRKEITKTALGAEQPNGNTNIAAYSYANP